MYSLLTEFRDGDNVVTTLMEHNSNFVPWHALTQEVLPRLGRRVECRLARFDHDTGELDLAHLAELVDHRTKLVCVTGASNFLGTKPPLGRVRQVADDSGYRRPDGTTGSLLLVDAAQLAPTSVIDVAALDVDYLAFSFHKVLAPFGVGVLYGRETLLERSLPFLYGGDMIAEGKVSPERVEYNELPWKYVAGTPNVLGVIASAQALRLLGRPGAGPRRAVVRQPPAAPPGGRGVGHEPGAAARARPDRRRARPGAEDPGTTGLRTPTRRAEIAVDGVQHPAGSTPERSQMPWTAAGSRLALAATARRWPTTSWG